MNAEGEWGEEEKGRERVSGVCVTEETAVLQLAC